MIRQRVVYSHLLSASHDTSLDHSVFGTTPCIAPPSRRKFPPLSIVSFASPIASTRRSYLAGGADQGVADAAGATGTGGAGGASTVGAADGAGAGAAGAGVDAVASTVFGLWLTIQSATRATSPKRVSFPSSPRNAM